MSSPTHKRKESNQNNVVGGNDDHYTVDTGLEPPRPRKRVVTGNIWAMHKPSQGELPNRERHTAASGSTIATSVNIPANTGIGMSRIHTSAIAPRSPVSSSRSSTNYFVEKVRAPAFPPPNRIESYAVSAPSQDSAMPREARDAIEEADKARKGVRVLPFSPPDLKLYMHHIILLHTCIHAQHLVYSILV